MPLQTNKELQDAALAYSMCGPWSMRTHPKEHFNHGTGQMERYTHFLNGLEAGASEYATKAQKLVDALQMICDKTAHINDYVTNDIVKIANEALAEYNQPKGGKEGKV